jgi:hypothetical protein
MAVAKIDHEEQDALHVLDERRRALAAGIEARLVEATRELAAARAAVASAATGGGSVVRGPKHGATGSVCAQTDVWEEWRYQEGASAASASFMTRAHVLGSDRLGRRYLILSSMPDAVVVAGPTADGWAVLPTPR